MSPEDRRVLTLAVLTAAAATLATELTKWAVDYVKARLEKECE